MDTKNAGKLCICDGEHSSSRCRRKNTTIFGRNIDFEKIFGPLGTPTIVDGDNKQTGSKYQPRSVRDGAVRIGKGRSSKRDKRYHSVCITNLSDSFTQTDLKDLVKDLVQPDGPVMKLFVGKDKITGECNGLAYVHFKFREDAAKAISLLNGYGYDHLILSVDFSERSKNRNQ